MTAEQSEKQAELRAEGDRVNAQIMALYGSYELEHGAKATRAAAERKLARLQARLIELHKQVMEIYDL